MRQALGLSINRISIISGLLHYSYYEHPLFVNTEAMFVRVQTVDVTGSLLPNNIYLFIFLLRFLVMLRDNECIPFIYVLATPLGNETAVCRF